MAGAQDGEEEGLRLGQALFEVDMIFLKQIRADPTVSTGIAVTAVINLPASGGRKEFVYDNSLHSFSFTSGVVLDCWISLFLWCLLTAG